MQPADEVGGDYYDVLRNGAGVKVGIGDVTMVGGKNASLGELLRELAAIGVSVPEGFATTATAYWQFLDSARLRPLRQGRG